MSFGGIADFVAALKVVLELTGASFIEGDAGRLEQGQTPRYVWVYDTIEPADRKGTAQGASLGAGGTTQSLSEDAHKAIVHIWGTTRTECEQMRGALIQATRNVLKGRNYQAPVARWFRGRADGPVQDGYRLDQELVVYLQLAARDFPLTPPAAGSFSSPERAYGTTTITEDQLLESSSGAAAGDGELQSGEG